MADERALFVLLLFLITFTLSHLGLVMQNGLLESPEETGKARIPTLLTFLHDSKISKKIKFKQFPWSH